MSTLYDEVLYGSLPFRETHPDRLATIATLFGMEPAPLNRCRVLEVGCSDGENLIPMAFHYPGSEFLGIDAAEVAIRDGNAEIGELGLTNIKLVHADIMEDMSGLGTFDYAIAHGLYSWVPEPVRDRLMEILQGTLGPNGVGYVSYNALPGGRIREMLREMMLFRAGGVTQPDARVEQAREVMKWFVEAGAGGGESGLVKEEAEAIVKRARPHLFHDELSAVYHPVYFQEFLGHAARFGLQYLCESNFHETQPGQLPAAVVQQVERAAGGDRIRREQYFDFLKCRMFRRTLLCHAGIALPPDPAGEGLRLLYATSPAKPVSARPDLREGVAEEFRGRVGPAVTTAHPLTKAVMLLLNEAWPGNVAFPELLKAAAQLAPAEATEENLAHILMATYSRAVIELHCEPAQCVARVSPRPMASAMARSQAARGRLITTATHLRIEAADEPLRRLIVMLDGEHELADLVRELAPLVKMTEAELGKDIEGKLVQFLEGGLLVG